MLQSSLTLDASQAATERTQLLEIDQEIPTRLDIDPSIDPDPPVVDPNELLVAITVVKGSSTKTFIIHQIITCNISPFLASEISLSARKPARTNAITVQDTCRVAFAMFVRWLYAENHRQRRLGKCKHHVSAKTWIEACLLAEKIQATDFYAAAAAVLTTYRAPLVLSVSELQRIWARTRSDSPLRQYCLQRLGEQCFAGLGLRDRLEVAREWERWRRARIERVDREQRYETVEQIRQSQYYMRPSTPPSSRPRLDVSTLYSNRKPLSEGEPPDNWSPYPWYRRPIFDSGWRAI
ncbi:hypothetical protein LZ554_008516 [Drepanopeziza brunnea f. sp. 'monogermtubi']|nr:hypothetical protein LZ554_008516 [Drepanopeziza brunnea f. sp. 'monogermtubi']